MDLIPIQKPLGLSFESRTGVNAPNNANVSRHLVIPVKGPRGTPTENHQPK